MEDYSKEYEKEINNMNKGKKGNNSKFSFFVVICLLLLLCSLFYAKFLSFRYQLIILAIAGLLAILAIVIRKRFVKILSGILILLMAFGIFYGQFKINKLAGVDENVTHTMSFVVLKDSEIEDKKSSKGKTFAYSSDTNKKLWENFKKKEAAEYDILDNLKVYDKTLDSVRALYDEEVDVLLLDEVMRSSIRDEFENFDDETRVLGNFKFEDKRDLVDADKVNVSNTPFIAYISGIDTEGDISSVSRSDVNILAVVNPRVHKILLVSIPRDTYLAVDEFDGNKDKLTHTGLYGIKTTMDTVAKYFDVKINYYAKFNFTSVINILDIIGDVEAYSHYNFSANGFTFHKGMNTMGGKKALTFVRERYSLPDGDSSRGVHQMELIKGTINSLLKPSNLIKIGDVMDEISDNLETNMTGEEISLLISKQLDNGGGWDISQAQLKGEGMLGHYSYLMPDSNLYVMDPYDSSRDEIKEKIVNLLDENK